MLAWRNLIHDKVRLAVTLTGIVFAVVLIVAEFGLFLGFTTTTSSLIDRSGANLWIIAKRVPYIELGVPFSERKLSVALATPGVQEAQKYVVPLARDLGYIDTTNLFMVGLSRGGPMTYVAIRGRFR